MPNREYPRWVHHPAKAQPSVVVHSAEAEDAQLAAWEPAPEPEPEAEPETEDEAPAKRKGGWPAGKPRKPRED